MELISERNRTGWAPDPVPPDTPDGSILGLPRVRVSGLTLVEIVITVALIGVTVAGISVMNSNAIALVRTNKESTAANAIIQERVEQMRTANWRLVTSPAFLGNLLLSVQSLNANVLGEIAEEVRVSAWPDPSVVEPLIVRRNGEGVQIVSHGAQIANQPMARIDFDVVWNSGGRERLRSTSTVMSRGGLNRFNLPIAGNDAFPGPSPLDPEYEPGIPIETGNDGSAAPTPSPTPAAAPGNSGNSGKPGQGQGRGNVGGKKGKG